MKYLKSVLSFLLAVILVSFSSMAVAAQDDIKPFDVKATSALLMDYDTGTVLYAKNANEPLSPASVTKIMTLLLIMEEIDSGNISLDEKVSASEYASGMGGSQIYLKPGEEMTVEDMLKSIIIASANDAAVAMAEKVAGSEEAFVSRMNERAKELGMNDTNFENTTGLDDDTTNHVTSAYDIALMSRELLKHETILNYSGIWMDSVRDGAFGLTNTNRLIRFYSGATGLKTGSTSKAGFCISATAKRDGMHLIAVIMGSSTRDERNEAAKTLLDWGFANYSVYHGERTEIAPVKITGGMKNTCGVSAEGMTALMGKGKNKNITYKIELAESHSAPIFKGDKLGEVIYTSGDEEIGRIDIIATEDVEEISFLEIFVRLFERFILK